MHWVILLYTMLQKNTQRCWTHCCQQPKVLVSCHFWSYYQLGLFTIIIVKVSITLWRIVLILNISNFIRWMTKFFLLQRYLHPAIKHQKCQNHHALLKWLSTRGLGTNLCVSWRITSTVKVLISLWPGLIKLWVLWRGSFLERGASARPANLSFMHLAWKSRILLALHAQILQSYIFYKFTHFCFSCSPNISLKLWQLQLRFTHFTYSNLAAMGLIREGEGGGGLFKVLWQTKTELHVYSWNLKCYAALITFMNYCVI